MCYLAASGKQRALVQPARGPSKWVRDLAAASAFDEDTSQLDQPLDLSTWQQDPENNVTLADLQAASTSTPRKQPSHQRAVLDVSQDVFDDPLNTSLLNATISPAKEVGTAEEIAECVSRFPQFEKRPQLLDLMDQVTYYIIFAIILTGI